MSIIVKIGYNKEIKRQAKIKRLVDKATECPHCKIMSGKSESTFYGFKSTCTRCGLIWRTIGI